jgi:hypothetical protein
VAQAILDRITLGENVRDICKSPGMPHQATFYLWLEAHPQLHEQYTRARKAAVARGR